MKLFLVILIFTNIGCSSYSHLSPEKSGWFSSDNGLYRRLYYCDAENKADPKCYEATTYNNLLFFKKTKGY